MRNSFNIKGILKNFLKRPTGSLPLLFRFFPTSTLSLKMHMSRSLAPLPNPVSVDPNTCVLHCLFSVLMASSKSLQIPILYERSSLLCRCLS